MDHPEAHMTLAYDIARGRSIVARQLRADALDGCGHAGSTGACDGSPVLGVRLSLNRLTRAPRPAA